MQGAITDDYRNEIQTYGLDFIKYIAETLRPFLPFFIPDKQLISVAIAIIALLFPIAIGTTITAAELMTKIAIFGVKTTISTAELVTKAGISSASLLTDVLIRKPIFLLTYPLRKYSENKEIMKRLELVQINEKERQSLMRNCQQALKQPQKLFIILREIKSYQVTINKDVKVLVGSLQENDRVARLIQIVRTNAKIEAKQTIQFICKGTMLKMDEKLAYLSRNHFGAIQIYYTFMEPFG